MKVEEAIKYGKEQLDVFGGDHAEFIKIAVKALEKQIPTGEPKKVWEDARGYTGAFICTECDDIVTIPIMSNYCNYKFCPHCGQKWNE